MGRISLDTARIPQRKPGMPVPDASFGQAEIAAKAQQGAVIGRGVQGLGAMAMEYAAKNKQADIQADDAAFSLYSRDRMTAAADEAAKTGDPEHIKDIYARAEQDITAYVDGSSDNGTPNIKWKDHQAALRNHVTTFKGAIREEAAKTVLNLYKRDTAAKMDRQYMEAVASGDDKQLEKVASTMAQSGRTPEEIAELATKGRMAIQENAKAKEYNALNAVLAEDDFLYETGQITTTERIGRLDEYLKETDTIHEDYRDQFKARIYAKKTQMFKVQKKDLYDGFTRISKGLESGEYSEKDLNFFMGSRVKDYNDLVLVADQARKAVEESKIGGAPDVLTAVNNAFAGQKKNKKGETEPYTITDAFDDLKASNSSLAPLGAVILGAAMMAPDSGADEEAIHYNWTVDTNPGLGRKPVAVSPDSMIAEGVKMMGNYIAPGDKDAKWIEKTFDKIIKISNDGKLTEEEKRVNVSELFKGKARILAEEARAPQQNAQEKSVVRTGTKDGRKVVQYSDGSIEYAD